MHGLQCNLDACIALALNLASKQVCLIVCGLGATSGRDPDKLIDRQQGKLARATRWVAKILSTCTMLIERALSLRPLLPCSLA